MTAVYCAGQFERWRYIHISFFATKKTWWYSNNLQKFVDDYHYLFVKWIVTSLPNVKIIRRYSQSGTSEKSCVEQYSYSQLFKLYLLKLLRFSQYLYLFNNTFYWPSFWSCIRSHYNESDLPPIDVLRTLVRVRNIVWVIGAGTTRGQPLCCC